MVGYKTLWKFLKEEKVFSIPEGQESFLEEFTFF